MLDLLGPELYKAAANSTVHARLEGSDGLTAAAFVHDEIRDIVPRQCPTRDDDDHIVLVNLMSGWRDLWWSYVSELPVTIQMQRYQESLRVLCADRVPRTDGLDQ